MINNYKYHSPNTLDGDLEIMLHKTLLNYETIKNVLFYPYLNYRTSILTHLKNSGANLYIYGSKENTILPMFYENSDYINNNPSQLAFTVFNRAFPIIEKHKEEFIEDLRRMFKDEPERILDDEDEANFSQFIVEGMTEFMYEQDTFFQLKFNKLLERLEEDYKNKILQQIAFEKIKRNKLFILGLSMKLSMRDCGFKLVSVN